MSKTITSTRNSPLLVIVGQTASGKSALAMEIALKFNGQIISADSRTIYQGLDISTAKPTQNDQQTVKHYGLDIIKPDQSYSAAKFKEYAVNCIDIIGSQNKLPILVGGSGLYINSVIYDFDFLPEADLSLRKSLENLSIKELKKLVLEKGFSLPYNENNPRHLVRLLETDGLKPKKKTLRENTLVIGLKVDQEAHNNRIKDRIESMLSAGLLNEISDMKNLYGWEAPGLQSPAFKAFKNYFEDQKITLNEAKKLFAQYDWQLARRQSTWFKSSKDIFWFSENKKIIQKIESWLN